MGKLAGFMTWDRALPKRRPAEKRVTDYLEIYQPQSQEQIERQAGRCMDCGVPFCMQGCPLGNPIPDFNDMVYRGRYRQAYELLASTNCFPEFTGRLCPAPCETACTLAIGQHPDNKTAITIEEIEKQIIERAFRSGWVEAIIPAERTGKKVAVVGSGPAGLAAAMQLNRAGHEVTVFERADRVGGLLRYGIPDFKLEKHVIDRRVALLEEEGVVFRTGVNVGESPTWAELDAQHDALLIATGSRRPRDLKVPGRELDGVVFAMHYLEQQNRLVAGDAAGAPQVSAAGKHVVILGGGDTGSDCLGTAHRQGAASVSQVELFPSPPLVRAGKNPWPQWPLVLATTSSQQEGGKRHYALMTKRLEGEHGKLRRLCAARVAIEEGRLVELASEDGGEVEMQVGLLILAMGFVGPQTGALVEQLGLTLDGRGNVKTDTSYATSRPAVFAAGDAHRGQSLIVWAIMEGREAARCIDEFLTHQASVLPTRGDNRHFGGR